MAHTPAFKFGMVGMTNQQTPDQCGARRGVLMVGSMSGTFHDGTTSLKKGFTSDLPLPIPLQPVLPQGCVAPIKEKEDALQRTLLLNTSKQQVGRPPNQHGLQWRIAVPRGRYLIPRYRSVQADHAMCGPKVLPRCTSHIRLQEQDPR